MKIVDLHGNNKKNYLCYSRRTKPHNHVLVWLLAPMMTSRKHMHGLELEVVVFCILKQNRYTEMSIYQSNDM